MVTSIARMALVAGASRLNDGVRRFGGTRGGVH